MSLADRIKYEGESTTLDFKKSFYSPARRADLISDVMAMANAATKDDRYIIFGVKLDTDGTKTFYPLEAFPDPAEIEQLVLQNIEPAVHVEFSPFEFEGHALAYLRIHRCNDQPYLMKKDYSPLTQGMGKIRKGTITLPLLRADMDRIFQAKSQSQDLREFIKIQWNCEHPSKEICVRRQQPAQLPSKLEADKIQRYINNLKRIENEKNNHTSAMDGMSYHHKFMSNFAKQNESLLALSRSITNLGLPGYGESRDPYQGMTMDELKAKLDNVTKDFEDEDIYYIYSELGEILNLQIHNDGPCYLDDALVILTIPRKAGLMVASEIPRRPSRRRGPLDLDYIHSPHQILDQLGYPSVEAIGDEITVKAHLNRVRNGVITESFEKPLRVVLAPQGATDPIPIRVKLVARGLESPFEDVLFLLPVGP
ncbi:MAG: hypothetical protein H6Q00_923 [Holophagaceae bacterium]|nr:hypothetical protein [Holophagaceae bacterium]